MRIIGRNDLFLLLGLAVALFAITSRPIGRALVYAQEIERSMGLQLLPGLVILAGVFVFHLVRKRHEAREEALTASTELRQATARAAEMERLVEFGKALAQSLTYESVRAAAVSHIPTLTGGRHVLGDGSNQHALAKAGGDRRHPHRRLRAHGPACAGRNGAPAARCSAPERRDISNDRRR